MATQGRPAVAWWNSKLYIAAETSWQVIKILEVIMNVARYATGTMHVYLGHG